MCVPKTIGFPRLYSAVEYPATGLVEGVSYKGGSEAVEPRLQDFASKQKSVPFRGYAEKESGRGK
jgi:hypothetical protein